jgi:hypothetical protein
MPAGRQIGGSPSVGDEPPPCRVVAVAVHFHHEPLAAVEEVDAVRADPVVALVRLEGVLAHDLECDALGL